MKRSTDKTTEKIEHGCSPVPHDFKHLVLTRETLLRPKPELMKVLQLAGGVGETFTARDIFNLVLQYVRKRRLYDKWNIRIVHCGKDLLGAALGVDTFKADEAVKLFRENCTREPVSWISVWADKYLISRFIICHPQATTASSAASYTTAAQPARKETTMAALASMSSYHHPADQIRSADSYKDCGRNSGSCEEQRCLGETGPASAVTLGTKITTVAKVEEDSEEIYTLTVRDKEMYNRLLKVRDGLEKLCQMNDLK